MASPTKRHPYGYIPARQIWKKSLGGRTPFEIEGLWQPKFLVDRSDSFSTYGSCFAQRFSAQLLANDFDWVNTERPPTGMSKSTAQKFNYGIYSSRTQNIYTPTMLQQWLSWSFDKSQIPEELFAQPNGYVDPFRPTVEPDGFVSGIEARDSREFAVEMFRDSILKSSIFVFTLGLTERWINSRLGYEYAICPGTVAGKFSRDVHKFTNLDYGELLQAMMSCVDLIRAINPEVRIILTVSPIPLAATYECRHVLLSTIESKSLLRSVAGAVAKEHSFVDYFPSFEIVSSFPFRGVFFENDLRSVSAAGVDFVMKSFFEAIGQNSIRSKVSIQDEVDPDSKEQKLLCEEELLGAFS